MADEPAGREDAVPPPSEQVHLPGPSLLPALTALGITIALVGLIMNWVICGIGVVLTIGAIAKWISETRTEIAELPLDHGH